MAFYQNNYFILTGAMGGGKSTIADVLRTMGLICIPDPARKILAEQRLISAEGVPEENSDLFTRLMLSRAVKNYIDNQKNVLQAVVFDRGIPDLIAYAELFGIDTQIYYAAAEQYRYNRKVFCFRAWEEIYTTDDERKMTLPQAHDFGERTCELYHALGYRLVEVPPEPVERRSLFIRKKVKELLAPAP